MYVVIEQEGGMEMKRLYPIMPDNGDWAVETRGLIKYFGQNRAVNCVKLINGYKINYPI